MCEGRAMGVCMVLKVKVASEARTCPPQAARRWRHGEVPEYLRSYPIT